MTKITKLITWCAVLISYISISIEAIIQILRIKWISLIYIIVIIVKIISLIRSYEKKRFSFVDIVTIILFAADLNQNLKIFIQLKRDLLFIKASFIYDITLCAIAASSLLIILVIINCILSEHGKGITAWTKELVLSLKYLSLYSFLNFAILKNWNNAIESVRRSLLLTETEIQLLIEAVRFWYENKSAFPVVLRTDANRRLFMRNWLFNISLISGENIVFNRIKENNKYAFKVDVNLNGSHLAIINNSGKRFLRKYYNHTQCEFEKEKSKEIHRFFLTDLFKEGLNSSKNKDQSETLNLSKNMFFRWGSAGTIPVVKWRGEKWIALVFRDIYPMGWNLPLGGSESELEKVRPSFTAYRELLEELMILKQDISEYGDRYLNIVRRKISHPFSNFLRGDSDYENESQLFYRKQQNIIEHTLNIRFLSSEEVACDDNITCKKLRTNLTVSIRSSSVGDTKLKTYMTNGLVSVSVYEQGVECIKPVCFEIDDDNALRMGEVDYIEEQWINNPVILIKLDELRKFFVNNNRMPFSDIPKVGMGLRCSVLENPSNYHIFGLNLGDREQCATRLKQENMKERFKLGKRYRRRWKQIEYLSKFMNNCKDCFDASGTIQNTNKDNPALYLCPNTWEALSYFFSPLYTISEIEIDQEGE